MGPETEFRWLPMTLSVGFWLFWGFGPVGYLRTEAGRFRAAIEEPMRAKIKTAMITRFESIVFHEREDDGLYDVEMSQEDQLMFHLALVEYA